jgi:DNA-binding SARP family transcriptional activator
MRWRVLGPVRAWDGRAWRPIAAAKQRQLLAILLTHPDQVLERTWLVDVLWDSHAPGSAGRLLAHYVWRLRQLPGVGDVLCSVPDGYQLDAPPGEIDATRFTRLCDEGRVAARAGDHEAAAERLAAALGLWHGPALTDARSLPVLDEAARVLDQGRLSAREALGEALLRSGRPAEAVPVLEELLAVEPYREVPWQLLMQAMHNAGRRVDALLAYQRLWRTWVDQLGIEPGRPLREVHRQLLAEAGD